MASAAPNPPTTEAKGPEATALPLSELLQLKRWNTPTIYNGWEQITRTNLVDAYSQPVNLEQTEDFMPQMGPMCGYAVTVVCQPSKREHRENNPNAWYEYRKYVADFMPGYPKIVVVQDLDSPNSIGAFWGEVNSSAHLAIGAVGTITDGAIRDVDEMTDVGFKALARRLCVGHAHSWPVRWGCPVTVFGRGVRPGQLIHADKHGFIAIPEGEEGGLLDASVYMDWNECETVIPAARGAVGMNSETVLARLNQAAEKFSQNVHDKFDRDGEH